MKYYTNTDSKKPHMAFYGRFCPLHKGHIAIIEKKRRENPNTPVLILVRDTSFDEFDVLFRANLVKTWMEAKNIDGTILISPDINSVNYGRGVGYGVNEVEVEDDIKAISATKIRELIAAGDDSWKDLIACKEVADLLEEVL